MNVDTFTIEKMFLELDPNFEKLRDLKEDYIEFNNQEYESEFDVLTNLNALINIQISRYLVILPCFLSRTRNLSLIPLLK